MSRRPLRTERPNRGHSLHHADTGVPVALLRQTGRDDRVEILYWSSWKEKWVPTGPFARAVLPLDGADRVIVQEGIFWTRVSDKLKTSPKWVKSSSGYQFNANRSG
jgi:hypothetical protein